MSNIPFDELWEKTCRACGGVKPSSRFHKNAKCLDGHEKTCKDCKLERQRNWRRSNPEMTKSYRRKSQMRGKFGMEVEDYERMLAEQDGVCFICHKTCATGNRLAVDHDRSCCPGDRTCGKCIRKLLCGGCNRGLGFFMDDPELLSRASAYLS